MAWMLLFIHVLPVLVIHPKSLAVFACPNGAPLSACDTMTPDHGYSPQTSPPPYSVLVLESTVVLPGEQVTVTIVTTDSNVDGFEGILLKAISADLGESTAGAVGSFQLSSKEDQFYHTLDCSDIANSAVTHSNTTVKTATNFTWIAPSYEVEVQMIATLAESKETFWVGVRSTNTVAVISNVSSTISPCSPPPSPPNSLNADYSVCGKSRNCFGNPDGCVERTDCDQLLTFSPSMDNSEVNFEVMGHTPGYIAIGISTDQDMGDDSVIESLLNSTGGVTALLSFNLPDHTNHLIGYDPSSLTLHSSSYTDGILQSSFSRPMNTTVGGITTDLSRSKYYILLAYGPSTYTDIEKHDQAIASSEKVNLSNSEFLVMAQHKEDAGVQIRIHGSLMTVAWIGLVSLAIFLARYFKDMWPDTTHCKVKPWFAWHRFLNSLTVLLTLAAFILIFVYVNGFSAIWKTNLHPILGCITTSLAVLQPLGALLRPHPGAPNRIIFNWIHFTCGTTTSILAVVNMFLAVSISAAGLPYYTYWILTGYVSYSVVMFGTMEIFVRFTSRQQKSDKEPLAMPPNYFKLEGTKPTGTTFREVMLRVLILGNIGFCTAMVTAICI